VKLTDIINITRAEARGIRHNIDIGRISTDSRTINRGELFIALDGKNFCSNDFITDAVNKGASAVIANERCVISGNKDTPLLIVKNTRDALSSIAKAHRELFKIPFICIVGSNGKTTTKDLISHILGTRFNVLKTEENHNNQIGIAKTLLKLENHDMAVIEAGTNSPGEIAHSAKVIRPDIVVTTNIGMSHLEGLKTIDGILREKMAMVEALRTNGAGTWVKNLDDKALSTIGYEALNTIGFAIRNKNARYNAEGISCRNDGMEFSIKGECFFIPLVGVHNIYNSLAAIAVTELFMERDAIRQALFSFNPVSKRMQIQRCGSFKVIDDTYNANPNSLECAVAALKDLTGCRKRFFVCADMMELGENSRAIHYDCGKFIARSEAIDSLILFGQYAVNVAQGAIEYGMNKDHIIEAKEKTEIVDFLKQNLAENDVVLIKGSRSMKMEEVVHGLFDSAYDLEPRT
jgi:UDP-N-acetylmuramoyl-tripeptide--D-alanyl-D-alanine ligase